MKLLYVCADRATDPLLWSGTVFNCLRALKGAGAEVAVFDQIPFECPPALRVRHVFQKRFGSKIHYLQLEPAILERAARRITARFAKGDCDAIFCPGTGVPVHAFLPAEIPVFCYLDATKQSWIRTYFGLDTLCRRSLRHVAEIDRRMLDHHTLTIFSSDWAADEARREYAPTPGRIAVVPFGANLDLPPMREEVTAWIAARSTNAPRLLFLGKEWARKGGPEAVSVVRALRAAGFGASLDVVGCRPVLSSADQAFTRIHGFVDHHTPGGRAQLHELFRHAHALLFLSHAEAYGIALCEAAAFGVPAYASNVGGIPTIIRDGVNGWLAPAPISPAAAAATLGATFSSAAAYRKIAQASRDEFSSRLNWPVAGTRLLELVKTHLPARKHLPSSPV